MQVLLSELEFGVLVLRRLENRRKARTKNKLARGTTLPAHSLDHLWGDYKNAFSLRDSGAPFAYQGTRDGEKPAYRVYFWALSEENGLSNMYLDEVLLF